MAKRDLHTLIRVREWDVDEKRRSLGEILKRLYALEEQARELEASFREEQRIAAASPSEAGFFYGTYAHTVIERREELARLIAEAETRVAKAQDRLRAAHGELRKFEMAQDRRDKEALAERERKDQAIQDEIGIRGFLRRRGQRRAGERS